MKTPREILFERHRNAGPKLDELRTRVIASLRKSEHGAPPHRTSPPGAGSLRDLLLSLRWHLAGLSAAWLLVAALNTEPAGSTEIAVHQRAAAPPRQILAELREQRRRLAELLAPKNEPQAVVPQALSPRRRGEPLVSSTIA